MTSIAPVPQAISTPTPAITTPPAAPAKAARAADGDYKTKGVGHDVKDADGDYKPTNATTSAASSSASSTLSAVTSLKLGG